MTMMTKLDNALKRDGAPLWPGETPTGFSVGWDYDDVVMPWFEPAVKVCERAGINYTGAAVDSWKQYEQMGCTFEEWLQVLGEATVTGELYDTVPFEGAVEAMRRLLWAGHWIHIVTARGTWENNPHNERIHEITRAQLEEFAIPHHSLTFTKDKTVVPVDFFIDDSLGNYHALDQAGVKVYLLNRPWNRVDETNPDTLGLRRVDTVDEFVDIILQEAQ